MFHSSVRLLLSSMWLTLLQRRWKQYAPLKHWYIDIRLHSTTYHRGQYSTQSMPWELQIWQYSCSNCAKLWHFSHFMWNRNFGHVLDSTLEERIYFFWWQGWCPGMCTQWGTNFYTNILTIRKRLHPVLKIFLFRFQIKNNVSQ